MAIHIAITAPSANQFLICSAIFASLCTATFLSNVAVAFIFYWLPESLQPADLKQALRDVSAVRAIEKQRKPKQDELELCKSAVKSAEESTKQVIV